MTDQDRQNIDTFLSAIAPWRVAYKLARLSYVAYRVEDKLLILSARLHLSASRSTDPKPLYQAGPIVAGQIDLPTVEALERTIEDLLSSTGHKIDGHGNLLLPADTQRSASVSAPTLLHSAGLSSGDRLAVLTATGAPRYRMLRQPETDWALRASAIPYDTAQELFYEYGLGPIQGDQSTVEIIALDTIQVLARSTIAGTKATLGLFMANALDSAKAQLGYRVLDKGKVSQRGAIGGSDIEWIAEGDFLVGTTRLEVPIGAVVQCFATYDGHTHQTRWFADPNTFQNPRAAVLSLVETSGQLLRSLLTPELPPRGKAADEFESGICWVLWALGFAPCSFGLHPKTRDAFDIVAVSPQGHFLVVECTLGLLRADSKLSKLAARAASLRTLLRESNLGHLKVLPVIVTAMEKEAVSADADQARRLGIVVLTKENLERVGEEMLRLPDGDRYFEDALRSLETTPITGGLTQE